MLETERNGGLSRHFDDVWDLQEVPNPAFSIFQVAKRRLFHPGWLKGAVSLETAPRHHCYKWVFWPRQGQKAPVFGWKAGN